MFFFLANELVIYRVNTGSNYITYVLGFLKFCKIIISLLVKVMKKSTFVTEKEVNIFSAALRN